MLHFECPPISGNPLVAPLIFDWDEAAGSVSGSGAEEIKRCSRSGSIQLHPWPAEHEFSAAPLKSRADIAAIVGLRHRLPPELADAYPTLAAGEVDPDYEDDRPPLPDDPAAVVTDLEPVY